MAVDQTVEAPAPARTRPAWKVRLIGFLAWLTTRTLYLTLRLKEVHSEAYHQAVEGGEGAILVIWHGRSLIAANHYRKRGFWALISLSRDGEIQNDFFRRCGFQTIRGSTGRGGVKAALQLARKIKEGGILAFTPDGPRGPTHKVQQGTIFLAQRSGRPIIPFGISANPRKLLPTWDSYMVPLPFARAAVVTGDAVYVPADASEEEQARIARELESALNDVERRADEMVGVMPESAARSEV